MESLRRVLHYHSRSSPPWGCRWALSGIISATHEYLSYGPRSVHARECVHPCQQLTGHGWAHLVDKRGQPQYTALLVSRPLCHAPTMRGPRSSCAAPINACHALRLLLRAVGRQLDAAAGRGSPCSRCGTCSGLGSILWLQRWQCTMSATAVHATSWGSAVVEGLQAADEVQRAPPNAPQTDQDVLMRHSIQPGHQTKPPQRSEDITEPTSLRTYA